MFTPDSLPDSTLPGIRVSSQSQTEDLLHVTTDRFASSMKTLLIEPI